MKALARHFLVIASCLAFSLSALAQSDPAQSANVQHMASSHSGPSMSGEFGIGVKMSLLGVGAEIAAKVNHHSNVRAGFNVLGYSRTFDKDGINYGGHLSFRTIEAHYDYFPFAGKFHVSGGMLDYIGNPITANAFIPTDQSFTLGGVTYYSAQAPNQTSASGRVNFNQVSPTVTFGWGNLVRENHRFSVPIELGVAFQGSPKSTLGLAGQVCDSPSSNPLQSCTPTSDPTVQSNIAAEQVKLNNSMKPFRFYPIISFGFGYKF